MADLINVVVCGALGYTGTELVKMVLQHPKLRLIGVSTTQSEETLYAEIPMMIQHKVSIIPIETIEKQSASIDLLLLATPANISMSIVKKLANRPIHLIDLSGAYRLNANEFLKWYGFPHQSPLLLKRAYYGLLPWYKDKIFADTSAQVLIANPGCYATCALMSLIPLLKEQLIQPTSIIIDAKSGASGAGRQAKRNLMLCELAENFFPYKIGKHQHVPEINRILTELSGQSCQVLLTTHLLPMIRGLSITIYADVSSNLTSTAIHEQVGAAFKKYYNHYPCIRYEKINKNNTIRQKYLLSIKHVIRTPNIHIGYFIQGKKLLLFACLDNLLKGAASQAIENINALYNFPLSTGLFSTGVLQ